MERNEVFLGSTNVEPHYKQLIDTFIAKNPDKDQFVLKADSLTTEEWNYLYNKRVVMQNPEYRGIGFYFIDDYLVWIFGCNATVMIKNTKQEFKKLADKLHSFVNEIITCHLSDYHSFYKDIKSDVFGLHKLLDNCSCEELRDMLPKEEFFV